MGVEFEEPKVSAAMRMPTPQMGSITKMVLSMGVAKTARDAQIIMVVVALLLLGVSAYFFFTSSLLTSTELLVTPEQRQQFLQENYRTR